ncbi:hypothetical protein LTR01_002560 [Friedmanniomyces endolithicus]|nr:hypothetical protein LTR01_002560 [Friedmanniomyces endolithicus]KAK0828988.1 hypothetical protein LTR73_004621 [Friedmanniomyces endolithicus]
MTSPSLGKQLLAALVRRANMMPIVRVLCGKRPLQFTPAWPGLPLSVTLRPTATIPSGSSTATALLPASSTAQETAAVAPGLLAPDFCAPGLFALVLSVLLLALLFGLIAHSRHLLAAEHGKTLASLVAARESLATCEAAATADGISCAALVGQHSELSACAQRRIDELETLVRELQSAMPPPRPAYSDAATVTTISAPPPAPATTATDVVSLVPAATGGESMAKALEEALEAQKKVAEAHLEQTYWDVSHALKARSGIREREKNDRRVMAGLRMAFAQMGWGTECMAFQRAEQAAMLPIAAPSTELAPSFREWVYYWALDKRHR